MKRFSFLLPMLLATGCSQQAPPVAPPVPVVTPTLTPAPNAVQRLPSNAPLGRAFLGPIPIGSTVGASFVEARKLAGQLDELTPQARDFPVVWSFTARTISIEGRTFKSGALVNRTGFVACDEAAVAFDLKLEQHGDLTLFDPFATLGGTANADHVYRDPKELWQHDNGPQGPKDF